jgi:hypothetical protein
MIDTGSMTRYLVMVEVDSVLESLSQVSPMMAVIEVY